MRDGDLFLKVFAQSFPMIDIGKLTKEKARLIDEEMAAVLAGSVPNLHDAISYHMGTGGKRLRPLLAILTYEALAKGKDISEEADASGTTYGVRHAPDVLKIVPFAAACELLHNWFLIHDDLQDGDRVRRDKPTVWVKYGVPHAINVGDYMAQKVFELILRSREHGVDDTTILELTGVMVTAAVKTSEGQALDINMRSYIPTEKDYMDMVLAKTGHYLTVTMVGAAILAKRKEIIQHLLEFGGCIGQAFQITDDILDLTEGKGRGEIGRDIKEGKKSLLVIHCLAACSADEKSVLLGILNKSPEETSNEDVACAVGLLGKYNSIDYAKNKAAELQKAAYESIRKLPPELHEILEMFAEYLVKRKK